MKLARLEAGPEVFFSLQGEGKNQGAPSVFVRTSRCNLYCRWCDTPYTWNWNGTSFAHDDARKFDPERETLDLPIADVAALVLAFDCRRVVLTGGEPLLQAQECSLLLEQLRHADSRFIFEVETNGTLIPPEELDRWVGQYTVSPKLHSSCVDAGLRLRSAALEFFAASPKSVFKFVVEGAAEAREAAELVSSLGVDADRVYLMPCATSVDGLSALRAEVAAACLAHGYRFSDRLHIQLFGNRRGV